MILSCFMVMHLIKRLLAEEEHIEQIDDVFIALTNDDEANIMSQYARKTYGGKKAMVTYSTQCLC